MKKNRLFVSFFTLVLGILASSDLRAQDPVFTQFYASPLQLNPAFAGNALAPFISVNYRVQWPSYAADAGQPGYNTWAASYDQFVERFNSGFGISVMSDNQADIYTRNITNLTYAYRVRLTRDITAKLGVQVGAVQGRLDWSKLRFGDQIDPIRGSVFPTLEQQPLDQSYTKFDVSAGTLVFSNDFHVGLNLQHLVTPYEGFAVTTPGGLRLGLPMRTTLHGGYTYVIRKGTRRTSEVFVSPNFLFTHQSSLKQLNLGAYVGFGPLFGGAWFRHTFGNRDAMIMALGFRNPYFKFGYSYDFTISKTLAGQTGGAHEVSLIFNLDPDAGKRADLTDCMKMFR